MHFIHEPYEPEATIAAIATPPGQGGVAIIRISGKQALDVADKVFSRPVSAIASHTARYGKVIDAKGSCVDSALLFVMRGKKSYTGEDTAEIHCHGGSLVTRRVLETVLLAGARQARPGEFTYKAFINGKIDLTQAEAVQELIAAKNEHALDAAEHQLQGRLAAKVREFQQELTEVAAILEAWVDFPEEGLEFASLKEILYRLQNTASKMQQLKDTYHNGKIVHEGISLCLVGSPNVGKSSLMNALLDKERAIVTPIAGTTRDILEDDLRLNGLNFRLIDTAGIRESAEIIEQEGIRRSKEAVKAADLILFVLDASAGLTVQDRQLMGQLPPGKSIAVWNKSDLPVKKQEPLHFPHTVSLSAKNKTGLNELTSLIDQVIWEAGPPSKEEMLITNVRHKKALEHSLEALHRVIEGLQQEISAEFVSLDMRSSLQELGKVIGTNISEDILSSIFSTFCIGK